MPLHGLTTILAIETVLVMLAPFGTCTPDEFTLGFSFRYLLWASGFLTVIRSRRLTGPGMAEQGDVVDPLPQAIAPHRHDRSD